MKTSGLAMIDPDRSERCIDGEALQRCFDKCIGIGDTSNSPTRKLSKLLFTDE